ncbi:hypothetical protein ES703_72628 [subsurface metagenome]
MDYVPYRQGLLLNTKSSGFKARHIKQTVNQCTKALALPIYNAQEFLLGLGLGHLALEHQLSEAPNCVKWAAQLM